VKFWLGLHHPAWLSRTAVPAIVSHQTLRRQRQLPRALGPWVLDSGAFSDLSRSGEWTTTPMEYVQAVRRYSAEIGHPEWAASQDWMCEPFCLAKTGLSVREHQARTIASYLYLITTAPEVHWLPTLQGWTVADYLRHVDDYGRAGVDLRAAGLVGVGSVCKRQATGFLAELLGTLAGLGLRLHGFGLKSTGILSAAPWLASADSMAWSLRARMEGRPMLAGHSHRTCANCLPWALEWRRRLVEAAECVTGATLPMFSLGAAGC
jgi:hypothetical protein